MSFQINLKLSISHFLGADSKLYPFANMTFADMVNRYLPHYDQLDKRNVVRNMFYTGRYSQIVDSEREVSFSL